MLVTLGVVRCPVYNPLSMQREVRVIATAYDPLTCEEVTYVADDKEDRRMLVMRNPMYGYWQYVG